MVMGLKSFDSVCNSPSEIAVGDYVKRKPRNANRKNGMRSAKKGFGFSKVASSGRAGYALAA
jgi:hypothetical protein